MLCFLLLHLVPGDAADVLAAQNGSATAETMNAMRQRFGLDQPMLTQLVNYLTHLAHLDLGYSARFGMPVSELILQRLPNTLLLMFSALSMALVIGILTGWVGSWRSSPDGGQTASYRSWSRCFTRRPASGSG